MKTDDPNPDTPKGETAADRQAEQPKQTQKQPQPEKRRARADLQPASESSDPVVHKLLAELQAARMNRDALTANDEAIAEADRALEAAEKALADTGYR